MEAFGVPNVRLHPGTRSLLSQLEGIQEKPKLASMSTAFRAFELLSFLVRRELVKGLEANAHGYPVVIVCHASAS